MNCVGISEEEYSTVRQSKKKVALTIQGGLPNLNDYTEACRSNKYLGAKMKKKTEQIITFHIKKQLKTQFKGKVRLSFRWYEPNRKRDLDNICFAKKFILDALVSNGVIEADGWRCVVGFDDNFYYE